MNEKVLYPKWFLWLLEHPLLALCFVVIVIAGVPSVMALYLDYRREVSETEKQLNAPPIVIDSGAITPGKLPRNVVRGQIVYVPIYSHVYEGQGKELQLSCTLSIRNTDPKHKMTLSGIHYYNTEGKLIKEYLESPVELAALGTANYFVQQSDTTGGSGANFIVEWVADEPVLAPVIESVMMVRSGTGMTSFVRSATVLKQIDKPGEFLQNE